MVKSSDLVLRPAQRGTSPKNTIPTAFFPQVIYANEDPASVTPRAFVGPGSYIQGPGALDNLGRYLHLIDSKRPAILISERGDKRFGGRLAHSWPVSSFIIPPCGD